jgi:hypothetical protein
MGGSVVVRKEKTLQCPFPGHFKLKGAEGVQGRESIESHALTQGYKQTSILCHTGRPVMTQLEWNKKRQSLHLAHASLFGFMYYLLSFLLPLYTDWTQLLDILQCARLGFFFFYFAPPC